MVTCMSNLSLMHLKRDDFTAALRTCNDALVFDIKDEIIHQKILFREGLASRGLGDYTGALASVEKAVEVATFVHSDEEEDDVPPAPPSFLAQIAELKELCKAHTATATDTDAATATATATDAVTATATDAATATATDAESPVAMPTSTSTDTNSSIREIDLEGVEGVDGGSVGVRIEQTYAGTTTSYVVWDAGLVLVHYLSMVKPELHTCLSCHFALSLPPPSLSLSLSLSLCVSVHVCGGYDLPFVKKGLSLLPLQYVCM